MLVSHRTPAPQRPRVVGEEILLGKSTRLARLVAVRGCWEIDDWPEEALHALLTQAYGPSEAALQPLVKAVRDATYLLPRNPLQAARVLQGLPEPLADADPRLTQAERLLKAGADPRSLATAMRREGLNLRSAPAWSDRLALCDKGVVLGHGTVIVDLADHPDGSTGLAVEGNEANILALLSVASGRLVSPDALEKLASASRSLAKGNVAQAAIALCHIGQPPLEDQDLAKMLTVAASCLGRGHRPGDVMKACGFTASQLRKAYGTAEWTEELHPRDENGRFTDGNGGDVASAERGRRLVVADNSDPNVKNDAVRRAPTPQENLKMIRDICDVNDEGISNLSSAEQRSRIERLNLSEEEKRAVLKYLSVTPEAGNISDDMIAALWTPTVEREVYNVPLKGGELVQMLMASPNVAELRSLMAQGQWVPGYSNNGLWTTRPWTSEEVADRERILNGMAGEIAAVYGIQGAVPKVLINGPSHPEFSPLNPDQTAHYDPEKNVIILECRLNTQDSPKLIGTLAHEMTHAWQDYQSKKTGQEDVGVKEVGEVWRMTADNTYISNANHPDYYNQPVERQAKVTEQYVSARIRKAQTPLQPSRK